MTVTCHLKLTWYVRYLIKCLRNNWATFFLIYMIVVLIYQFQYKLEPDQPEFSKYVKKCMLCLDLDCLILLNCPKPARPDQSYGIMNLENWAKLIFWYIELEMNGPACIKKPSVCFYLIQKLNWRPKTLLSLCSV